MMNKVIFFLSTRLRLRRSILVFFRILLFRFETMTKNMILFVTIVALDVCFIYTKTIIVEFFICFVSIRIVHRDLSVSRYISVFKTILGFFFPIVIEAIFFFLSFRLLFFVFLTKFEIDSIRFNNKTWFFTQIFVVLWRLTFNKIRLKKSCIAWSKLKCRWAFVEIFDRSFLNKMSIMINSLIDWSIFCFNFLIESV